MHASNKLPLWLAYDGIVVTGSTIVKLGSVRKLYETFCCFESSLALSICILIDPDPMAGEASTLHFISLEVTEPWLHVGRE